MEGWMVGGWWIDGGRVYGCMDEWVNRYVNMLMYNEWVDR